MYVLSRKSLIYATVKVQNIYIFRIILLIRLILWIILLFFYGEYPLR